MCSYGTTHTLFNLYIHGNINLYWLSGTIFRFGWRYFWGNDYKIKKEFKTLIFKFVNVREACLLSKTIKTFPRKLSIRFWMSLEGRQHDWQNSGVFTASRRDTKMAVDWTASRALARSKRWLVWIQEYLEGRSVITGQTNFDLQEISHQARDNHWWQ